MRYEQHAVPAVAGAMLAGGKVSAHTSAKGDIPPRLHPQVRDFLSHLPTEYRERYAGWCAEAILVSDRLWELDDAAARPLSPEESRSALGGSSMTATRIREAGDPTHGQYQPPCLSCGALLDQYGIRRVPS